MNGGEQLFGFVEDHSIIGAPLEPGTWNRNDYDRRRILPARDQDYSKSVAVLFSECVRWQCGN